MRIPSPSWDDAPTAHFVDNGTRKDYESASTCSQRKEERHPPDGASARACIPR